MRVNNWLSGFACVLLLGVVGCKKDKIREGIPVVVEKVGVDDVEIFGDYVGGSGPGNLWKYMPG